MIKNAKIVSEYTLPATYEHEPEPRGSKKLTVRSHILAQMLHNPHRWVGGYESRDSESKEIGTMLDCLLLTPFHWPKRYGVLPAKAPRRPSERQINAKTQSESTLESIRFWEQWDREHKGVEIVTHEQNAQVHLMAGRLREDKLIAELIDVSRKSVWVAAEWHDTPTGLVIPIKGLLDIVPPADHPTFSNSIWDLKTCATAFPRLFARAAFRFNYHLQARLYLDLYNAATGEMRGDFGHVVIENVYPYEIRSKPPLMSQRFLDLGQWTYKRALEIYCQCLATGVWPGYDPIGSQAKWPETDAEEWMLTGEHLYPPLDYRSISEDVPAEPPPPEEPKDLIP